jgi:DNA recombination protein Rad52
MKGRSNKSAVANADNSPTPPSVQGFEVNQLRKLQKPLAQQHVHVREIEGRSLSYIEGWYAISQANEIFGFAGWERETILVEKIFERIAGDIATCGYMAKVRIRVRAGSREILREGTGCGFATARAPGAAHERALKSAETDATKRALTTFGGQFGLNLYDKDQTAGYNRVPPKFVLSAPDGRPFADNLAPEAFLTGIRQLVEKCWQPAEINALLNWNNGSLTGLRVVAPDLRNGQGIHYVDLLLRLAERSIRRMEEAVPATPENKVEVNFRPLPAPIEARSEADGSEEFPSGNEERSAEMEPLATTCSGSVGLSVGFSGAGAGKEAKAIAPDGSNGDGSFATAPVVEPISETVRAEEESKIGLGRRIDKSSLPLGFERRVRSKQHLKSVGDLPCLICGRQPSHAHHVKFAQRRGLSQKVSDEFVVPLCALHHSDLHRAVSERDWWQKQGHDPLAVAAGLWDRFGRNLN